MPVKIHCPNCIVRINASEERAGQQVECDGCGTLFIVPAIAAFVAADTVYAVPYSHRVIVERDAGNDQIADREGRGSTSHIPLRIMLAFACAAISGSLLLVIGLFLLGTDPGKGNQIPSGIAWTVSGTLILLGTAAKNLVRNAGKK